jgi:hypothetical protein
MLNAADETCWLYSRPLGRGGRETVAINPICHRTLHRTFSTAELGVFGDSVGAIKADPRIGRLLAWIANKDAFCVWIRPLWAIEGMNLPQMQSGHSQAKSVPADGWRWLLFFLALSMTVMLAHELTHHVVARSICGAWGTMSWSTFLIAPGCDKAGKPWWIATLAGPLLTYVLIWIGAAWRSPVGLALLFANLPMGRIINVATNSGDEMVVGRVLFGESIAWFVMAVIVTLLLAWPLWQGWRQLPAKHRAWAFPALLFLALLWDLLFKRMLLGRVLPDEPTLWGVPVAIFCVLLVSAVLALVLVPRPA